jgi:predicted acylesterase/phospholipase RssA
MRSSGGIIALGLFKMGWSVERAIRKFEELSAEAFSKSDYTGIPIFRHSTQLLYSHRYKGEGLENALKQAFGQGQLFGPNEFSPSEKVKVGVLAAVPGGRRPYLFTNYSRNSTGQESDYLVREDHLEDELRCWEAARSTSAAPTYFPPYYHRAKRQHYVDGALHRNNPIQILEEERRAIWRDKTPPDILLSVGTGIQIGADGAAKNAGKRQKTAHRLLPKGIRARIAVGLDVVQSTLDCNRQWDEFVKSMKWDRNTDRVCHRLNIGLKERPPNLDDVDAISYLKGEANWYLRPDQAQIPYLNKRYRSAHKHIVKVARRLTAALFYFELIVANDNENCAGILHCRLSSAMRDNFRRMIADGPTFRVRQRIRGDSWCSSVLDPRFDERTYSAKINFQVRSLRRTIEMTLPKWNGSWERISGFSGLR